MSKLMNQRNIRWRDLLTWLRGSVQKNWGNTYTKRDLKTFVDGIHLTFLFWTDFLPAMECSPAGSMKRWCQTYSSVDPVYVLTVLKQAKDLFLGSLRTELNSYECFKHTLDAEMGSKCGALIAPLKPLLTDWFANSKARSFVAAYSCLSFPLRITFVDVEEQEKEAVQRFLATQQRVSHVQYPELNNERQCIEHWLSDFVFPSLMPWKHASGAVCDIKPKGLYRKAWGPGPDARLRYVNRVCGFQDDWYTNGLETDRTCVFQAVPKDATKKRAITMEPSVLMWHQRGMMDILDEYIRFKPSLSRRIDLHDQSTNQNLALKGSRSGDLSTIDLSDASDSVTLALVKELFRNTPIYRCLIAYRSDYVRMPDGSVHRLHSYGGMGNALTFRVQCLIYASVAETVIRENGGIPQQSQYHVYGDDIIIETRYANAMIRRLKELGFLPNNEKSWFTGNNLSYCYRESCGMEAMNGRDITPVRIPRKFAGYPTKDMSPEFMPQLIRLCNSFHKNGNITPRSYLVKMLIGTFPIAFGEGEDQLNTYGIPSNYRLKSRWGRYHRTEYWQTCVLQSNAVANTRPLDYNALSSVDDIRYYECLRQLELQRRTSPPLNSIDACPPRAMLYKLMYR